ncbi:MAG: hypothetical protein JSU05_10715 [Bacteroidetes bacterium]|nr:hypothetical protein [Bacteroidota bacterium]
MLFSNTELHQFFKLPLLIEHYREHKKEDPSITVLQFLKIHYQGLIVHDRDEKKDRQLPFQSPDCAVSVVVITDVPAAINFEAPLPLILKQQRVAHYYTYTHQHLIDIFQPPRFS